MRVATVISLLFFACAACALQLHHERRDGFGSPVIRRRSIQRIPPRRLAPRRCISSILGPDIAPRGNPMNPTFYHAPGHEALSQLKLVKEKHVIKSLLGGGFQVYRVQLGGESLVVKEINLAVVHNWTGKQVQEEVRGADYMGRLRNAFFDGKRYFILMEDLGHEWPSGVGLVGNVARNAMEDADRWYAGIQMKRVMPSGVVTGYNDYAWTHWHGGNSWKAEPVGRWRFWKSTEEKPWVRNDIHYSGIKEWQGGLPIFATLDGTSEKAQG